MGPGGRRSDEPPGDDTETDDVRSEDSAGEASNSKRSGREDADSGTLDSDSEREPPAPDGFEWNRNGDSKDERVDRTPTRNGTDGDRGRNGTDGDRGRNGTDDDRGRNGGPTTRGREDSEDPIRRFFAANEGPAMWIREVATSVFIVLLIGALLFGVSGVWPPMVAVESGSMDPNMVKGDLIVVTDPGRFAPEAATNDVGVVPYQQARTVEYRTFGSYGSVVVFTYPGRVGSPIIHRVRFHVEEGENWVDRADDRHLGGEECSEIVYCPAPHSGYITKGDNNAQYDQANGVSPPVKPEWITGVARVRIPYLGWLRLIATGEATTEEFIKAVTSGSGTIEMIDDGSGGLGPTDGPGGLGPTDGNGPTILAIGGAAAIVYGRIRRT